MGKGRWEKGDGDGRCSKGLEPPPSHSLSVPCPSSQGSAPSFFIPRGFHPHGPRFILGPGGWQCLERSRGAAAARCGCSPIANTINENPGKASRGVIKEITALCSILHNIGIIQSLVKRSHVGVHKLAGITGARPGSLEGEHPATKRGLTRFPSLNGKPAPTWVNPEQDLCWWGQGQGRGQDQTPLLQTRGLRSPGTQPRGDHSSRGAVLGTSSSFFSHCFQLFQPPFKNVHAFFSAAL